MELGPWRIYCFANRASLRNLNFLKTMGTTQCHRWSLLSLWTLAVGSVSGQTPPEELHVFSPKDSPDKKLEARVQAISPDRKMVQLIPKSGTAASVEILRLTLEDQQYLKGWLDQQVGAKSTNLRVTITSSASSTGRDRDIYTVQHRNLVYTVKVQNLDRRETGNLRLEMLVFVGDRISVTKSAASLSVDTVTPGRRTLFEYVEQPLSSMAYNRDQTVSSLGVATEEARYDGNTLMGEDKPLGYLLRILDSADKVVFEKSEMDPVAPEKLLTFESAKSVVGKLTKGVVMVDSGGDYSAE